MRAALVFALLSLSTACTRSASTPDAPAKVPAASPQAADETGTPQTKLPTFDAQAAMRELRELVQLGQRYYGAPRRGQALDRLEQALRDGGAEVVRQTFAATEKVSGKTYQLTNLIGRLHPEATRRVLLGSHFDTRLWAEEDGDPAQRNTPITGANDGTSGVAVVLGVLRAVAADPAFADFGLDVVLFDGEEFGRPGNHDYCKGSIFLAEHLQTLYPKDKPIAALVLDMVGDRDLRIRRERSSNQAPSRWLNDLVFELGRKRDGTAFSDEVRSTITDDHTPLQQLGIPAVLVIDLDYPYWHTQADTVDKVSEASLQLVGATVIDVLHALHTRQDSR